MKQSLKKRLQALEVSSTPDLPDPVVLALIDWLVDRYSSVVEWCLIERIERASTLPLTKQTQEACAAICDFAEAAEKAEPGASRAFDRKLDELDRRFN